MEELAIDIHVQYYEDHPGTNIQVPLLKDYAGLFSKEQTDGGLRFTFRFSDQHKQHSVGEPIIVNQRDAHFSYGESEKLSKYCQAFAQALMEKGY